MTETLDGATTAPAAPTPPLSPLRRYLRRSALLFALGLALGAVVAGGAFVLGLLPPLPTFSDDALTRLETTLDRLDREALMEVIGTTGPFAGILQSPWTLFLHNGTVAAVLVIGGLTAGIVTGLVLVVNGFTVGALLVLALAIRLPSLVILATVLPHGIFELTGFWLAGAFGFGLGDAFRRRRRREPQALSARTWIGGLTSIAALLLVAAFFELYVTPEIARLALRMR